MKLKASKTYRESDDVVPDLAREGCVNILGTFIFLREVRSVLLMSSSRKMLISLRIRNYDFYILTPAWDDLRLPARKNKVFTKLVEKSAFSALSGVNLNKNATFGKISRKKGMSQKKREVRLLL